MSRVFAYCRVSTMDQTTENQRLEIERAGFSIDKRRIVEESFSGSVAASERPGFTRLMDRMESGDILVVTKLDRLGRNARDVRATIEALSELGVKVHCLALGGVDLTSAAGRMTMQVLNAVAEFERDLLIERTNAGISRAKAEGKQFGRPSALSSEQQVEVSRRLAQGDAVAALARDFDTSRQTIMRLREKVATTEA
ncbi:recombinase family protein [Paraburkholderia sp. RL17-373-BIF-A]|uniref:recombinase family protein n=1 Tax=Paraburkholderia sp. RL17-373-BIF-A TaxID=3031629 RepID=UPI0038B76B64